MSLDQQQSRPISPDEAFAAYVADRGMDVRRAAFLLLGNPHDAEDLAQLALGRALVAWRKHGEIDNPDGYVYRIMVNERTRSWRRRRGLKELLTWSTPDLPIESPNPAFESLGGVLQAVQALPRSQRVAVVLRYYADCSVEETSNYMGCSPSAAKAYASRGLAALRSALEQMEDTTVGHPDREQMS